MSSSLPTESAADSAVQDFGLGPYDSSGEGEYSHGEDKNEKFTRLTLPDGGGPEVQNPDRLLSYPDEHIANFLAQQDVVLLHDPEYKKWFREKLIEIVQDPNKGINWSPFGASASLLKFRSEVKGTLSSRILSKHWASNFLASASLPGDSEAPVSHEHKVSDEHSINDKTKSAQPIVSQTSELPSDKSNPSARSDYFDSTVVGHSVDNIWADEDAGVYSSDTVAESELPGVVKNESTMDDFLGALGNAWSGYVTEDLSGAQGFPTTDYSENTDFSKSNDGSSGGRLVASKRDRIMNSFKLDEVLASFDRGETTLGQLMDTLHGSRMASWMNNKTLGETVDIILKDSATRVATNLALAGELAESVLKEFGKKDLTKRHILSYLQAHGHPQFLSSDVIRCLKHRHEVYVKDVLDEFPVARTASTSSLSSVRDRVIALEIDNMRTPEVAAILRRVAASITQAIVTVERSEDRNG